MEEREDFLLTILVVVILLAGAVYGGYLVGKGQKSEMAPTQEQTDVFTTHPYLIGLQSKFVSSAHYAERLAGEFVSLEGNTLTLLNGSERLTIKLSEDTTYFLRSGDGDWGLSRSQVPEFASGETVNVLILVNSKTGDVAMSKVIISASSQTLG